MDLLILGLNGLLLLSIWHFALRKAILDDHRDHLFDLRDELREEFIRQGWAMDSELYKRLRDLINGYLRFTERFSLMHVVLMEGSVRSYPAMRDARRQAIDVKLSTDNAVQEAYVKEFRRRASSIVMNYMVVSSGLLALATVLMLPFVLLSSAAKFAASRIRAGSVSLAAVMGEIRVIVEVALVIAANSLAQKILMPDFVEKRAFEQTA